MKNYWPLLFLFLSMSAVVGMSYYAESAKQHYEESRKAVDPVPVGEHDANKANGNAADPYQSPIWAKYVTWPGGVEVWAVVITMFVIAWQSAETRKAAEAGSLSAKAATESIGITIDRERARISCVGIDGPHVSSTFVLDADGGASLIVKIVLNFINDGETMAYNVCVNGILVIREKEETIVPSSITMHELDAPKHIRIATVESPCKIPLAFAGCGDTIVVGENVYRTVENGEYALHVCGAVTYSDIFGKEHTTPFHHRYAVLQEGNWEKESSWSDLSAAST